MIKSMTAYARGETQKAPYTIRVEARTYNSRHLDVALRLTRGFEVLEERIKGRIAQIVARGRVDIRVQIHDDSDAGSEFKVNLARAQAYHQALKGLKKELGLTEPITTEAVIASGNIIQAEEAEKDVETVWPHLSSCLEAVLSDIDAMRRVEGEHLAKDFQERLDTIEVMLQQIGEQAAGLPDQYRKRLIDRIDQLTNGVVEIDPVRIGQEAALLADRSDISEEIVRARSHIGQFRSLMKDEKPAGRPLNFLLQEFNREFNTMGSKSGKALMSHTIVAVKSELEKIREQIQNVE
jgi:uncharacterized protein (TIGR00255 family)